MTRKEELHRIIKLNQQAIDMAWDEANKKCLPYYHNIELAEIEMKGIINGIESNESAASRPRSGTGDYCSMPH